MHNMNWHVQRHDKLWYGYASHEWYMIWLTYEMTNLHEIQPQYTHERYDKNDMTWYEGRRYDIIWLCFTWMIYDMIDI